jgi:ribosomal protein L7/L12
MINQKVFDFLKDFILSRDDQIVEFKAMALDLYTEMMMPTGGKAPAKPFPVHFHVPGLGVIELDPSVYADVSRHLSAGNKISAIKVLRTAIAGLALIEAKAAVDNWDFNLL